MAHGGVGRGEHRRLGSGAGWSRCGRQSGGTQRQLPLRRQIDDHIGSIQLPSPVANLAGRSVNCRYGAANRAAIMQSRVNSTRVVGEAIARAQRPPRVWLQASTTTLYAHRYDAANDETTGIIGGEEPGAPETWRVSTDVVKAGERTLGEATLPRTRKVALR